jgi:uncharacterized membrane protein HdeD (DUF308 family)
MQGGRTIERLQEFIHERKRRVTGFQKFVIRAILGLGFAVVATRMFYGRVDIGTIVGLAIILVGLAYFAEYLRHRKKR